MVYCTNCGTKNDEGAAVCVKCGASLAATPGWRPERRRREKEEQDCFGLPHGGAIVGLFFGAIIIIGGVLLALQEWNVIEEVNWDRLSPFIVIIFGILLLAGAIYGYRRRS